MHWIYRACLEKNEEDLRYGVRYIFESVKYSSTEGIAVDNYYLQHGKQLYMGGYGQTFVDVITKFAQLLVGTQYELPIEKKLILSNLVRNTLLRSVRGQYTSYNALGRNISRKGNSKNGNSLFQIVRRMIDIDPEHRTEYENFIYRFENGNDLSYGIDIFHTHYFYSDYTLHTSPNYTFDVRMSSKRTVKCESINNENIKGYFLSYGSNNILVDGDEYYDIFPTWDWSRIPGVTAPHLYDLPQMKTGIQYGESDFAGGVSDSIYGVSAFIYNDSTIGISAKKSFRLSSD